MHVLPSAIARSLTRDRLLRASLLIVILVVAAGLRFRGLNWDQGHYAHPDEAFIYSVVVDRLHWPQHLQDLFNAQVSTMNPRRYDPSSGSHLYYAYGTLLLYVLKAVSNVVAKVGGAGYATMEQIYYVGRGMAATADLVTVLALYFIGRRLFDARVGLLAAALAAFTQLQIQYAHFYVAEPIMTMFLSLALLEILVALDTHRDRHAIVAGLMMGFAVATKPSGAAFAVAGVVLLLFGGTITHHRVRRTTRLRLVLPVVSGLRLAILAGVFALVGWAIFEPYAAMDIQTYLAQIKAESDVQRGITDVPYTQQYINTVPVLYQISQYVRFGAGIPLGLAAMAGFVWAAYSGIVRGRGRYLLLLIWIAPYTFSVMTLEAKWLRYMLPISPVLVLMASAMLWHWNDRLRAATVAARITRLVRPQMAKLGMSAVLIGAILWAIAYQNVYARPHNWVVASEWIYQHVPAGSSIADEHWDTQLPYPLPGHPNPSSEYTIVTAPWYDDLPPEDKLLKIESVLSQSDYLVLASDRLSKSIPRSPWRYAVTIRYYQLLFEGRLGFKPVAVIDNGPSLGGLRINESGEDDNVAVYDHPKVIIFRKERDLYSWEFDALFANALAQPWTPHRYGPEPKTLMLPTYRDPGKIGLPYFGGVFHHSWSAAVTWLLMLELLGLVGWVLLGRLFSRLPERGWAVCKVLGILLVSWLAWIVSAVGLLPSMQSTSLAVLSFLALLAALLGVLSFRWIAETVRVAWKPMLAFEGVFLLLFAADIYLRALNPDLWQPYFGGEKPMELAFINAILRSSQLPPYDPWFSGGYINYYYFGQWIAAELMRLSSVGPVYGFNLAVATMFALTGSVAASIGYAVGRQISRTAGAAAGALSVLLVMIVGNLDGAVQAFAALRSGSLSNLWWTFDFWRSTRLTGGDIIHEFPFFTFLYADLHAHMIAMPMNLALVLLGTYVVIERKYLSAGTVLASAAVAGLLAGAVAITNPWDVPAYTGLFALALLAYHVTTGKRWWLRLPRLVPSLVALVVVAVACYAPFFVTFKSFYGSVGLVHTPTPLWMFLDQLGLFLFVAAWWGVTRLWPLAIGRGALALGAILFVVGIVIGHAVLLLLVALLLVTLLSLLSVRSVPAFVWSALVAAGLFIWLGVEVFYLKDFLAGGPAYRMNTVFKFGLQSWILLALGSAGLVVLMVRQVRTSRVQVAPTVALVLLVLASLVYTVYGTGARLRQRFPVAPSHLTLNGVAFMRDATLQNESGRTERLVYDYEAIQWMNGHIRTPETIVEASIGPYRGDGARISMFTGLPAVMGWDSHESQQRYPDEIGPRDQDVDTLYSTTSVQEALAIIEKYGIRYIYVGPVERMYEYPPSGHGEKPQPYSTRASLVKFDRMVGRQLEVAYRNPGVTIYRVMPSWRWMMGPRGGIS